MDHLLSDCAPTDKQPSIESILNIFDHVELFNYGHNVKKYREPKLAYGGFEEFMDSAHVVSNDSLNHKKKKKKKSMQLSTTTPYEISMHKKSNRLPIISVFDTMHTVISKTTMTDTAALSPFDIEADKENFAKQASERRILIILDWDDTLFPTSSLRDRTNKKTSDNAQCNQQLSKLVKSLKKMFELMIELYGSKAIVIVSNASASWISKRCATFSAFAKFLYFLKLNDIQIISAASKYEQRYPESPEKWKEYAFKELFRNYFDGSDDAECIITSIGDSLCEYDASNTASKYLKNRKLHRVKVFFLRIIKVRERNSETDNECKSETSFDQSNWLFSVEGSRIVIIYPTETSMDRFD